MDLDRRRLLAAGALAQAKGRVIRVTALKSAFLPREIRLKK